MPPSSPDAALAEKIAADTRKLTGVEVKVTGHHRYNEQLACTRYVLGNGLTVLVLPDERAPIFAYQSWFRVGSKDEDPERTGLAHLFEHLMFKGTAKHPVGELDKEFESRGSQTNAATWVDWTYYQCALAARPGNLETVVDFESDRMRGLTLTQEVFASELDVVINERKMTVDDSVMGRISESLFATSFAKHSYRWPTIGHLKHLETMKLEHARTFYDAYYAPNNATVVVVGALDPLHVLTTIAKGYGAIPPSRMPDRHRTPEPKQSAPRHVKMSLPAVTSHVALGYRAPPQMDKAHAALEIASEALLTGDNARLYKRLVTDEELATEVDGFLSPFAEAGIFEVLVTVRPDADIERIQTIVQEELDRVSDGLTEGEWRKAQNGLLLSALDSMKDAEGLAENLGHHETNTGSFANAFEVVKRWDGITEADVAAAAKSTFAADGCTIVVNLPEAA